MRCSALVLVLVLVLVILLLSGLPGVAAVATIVAGPGPLGLLPLAYVPIILIIEPASATDGSRARSSLLLLDALGLAAGLLVLGEPGGRLLGRRLLVGCLESRNLREQLSLECLLLHPLLGESLRAHRPCSEALLAVLDSGGRLGLGRGHTTSTLAHRLMHRHVLCPDARPKEVGDDTTDAEQQQPYGDEQHRAFAHDPARGGNAHLLFGALLLRHGRQAAALRAARSLQQVRAADNNGNHGACCAAGVVQHAVVLLSLGFRLLGLFR